MENVFIEEIQGWKSWGEIFQSIPAFKPLIHRILENENLACQEISHLTEGTNAVFRALDYVIKIYAPKESGLDTEYDYKTELAVMKYAQNKGISVPHILVHGELRDKYLFRYIVMEMIEGKSAGDEFPTYCSLQKREAVKQLRNILERLNQPVNNLIGRKDLKKQAVENERLAGLSHMLIHELADCVEEQDLSHGVLVHGDITGENVLVSKTGEIMLIDFADCSIAPAYYELPAIVFELFRGDKEFVSEFMGDEEPEEFLDQLIKGLALHDFCGNILKDYFARLNIPEDSIRSLNELKQLLRLQLFGR